MKRAGYVVLVIILAAIFAKSCLHADNPQPPVYVTPPHSITEDIKYPDNQKISL